MNSILSPLIATLDSASWQGTMSEQRAEELLNNKRAGTYLFREDFNGRIYLSGISQEGNVQHSEIKKESLYWHGVNGAAHKSTEIFALIPLCLHCEESACVPLEAGV